MLKWLLTGGAIPFLLCLAGGFFLIYLKGGPFRRPGRMLSVMKAQSGEGGISPFRALMLALAGTLGVGNIVGVANAIYLGGAGALFWMWISALLAMLLKYAEILLAVAHRREGRDGTRYGGAYYYICDFLEARGQYRLGVTVASCFAFLMIADSLSMGCIIQVNAVSSALRGVCDLPLWLIALILLILTVPVTARGLRGISALTELLVPIMTAGYVILSAAVLILRRDAIGAAFARVFSEAFSVRSVGGGVLGFLTSRALRVGTMRGLLSNEAGCGTAPTAHASADAASPAAQGVWGILEVFVDTILLCTATALVILVAGHVSEGAGNDGVMLAVRAYSSVLGGWSAWFFCAAILCFGYATLLCWANYGMESLRFLSRRPVWRLVYHLGFWICIPIGVYFAPEHVWTVSDFVISAMTTVNLLMLVLMRREVLRETQFTFGSLR